MATMSIPERLEIAQWRPLGNPATTPTIVPRVLIFHTMVGYLKSTENMFRVGGFDGTESTFGVGGPWDGADLDGVVWQWQSLVHGADAQWDGNRLANSVETSDGGDPLRPWSPKQARSLIVLGAQWCIATGNPPELVSSPTGRGIGYHAQFIEWNRSNHSCPAATRIAQLRNEIIPGIQSEVMAILKGDDMQEADWTRLMGYLKATEDRINTRLGNNYNSLKAVVTAEGTSPAELDGALKGLASTLGDEIAAKINVSIGSVPGATIDPETIKQAVKDALMEGIGAVK